MDLTETLDRAAAALRNAEALLIATGAGMGVDSGLPDFRGNEGFWKAYPPFKAAGKTFIEMANPTWFARDPAVAWGFYGHRLQLYRATQPHPGFQILRRWIDQRNLDTFVITSNVDGHFQKAGFDPERVFEVHGSILHLQCVRSCQPDVWDVEDLTLDIDPATFRAADPLPKCRCCGKLARPNVLMFGDWGWLPVRTERQQERYNAWVESINGKRLVIIEIGAGLAVPTIRIESESRDGQLIRINPREPEGPDGHLALPLGGLAALQQIDSRLDS